MNHFVFISHSSKDASIVQMIFRLLEENGIPCWVAPRDVKHMDWADAIMDGIWKSDVCIIVISGSSIISPEVFKEI
ncbi:MAG: toll/interleukin-1 receptor domain-containing protein, partial [Lachnospiraceae bacterium]